VGKWESRSDFQGGLRRRLFHNLVLCPFRPQKAFSYMAGCQVITHGRIGVITEVRRQSRQLRTTRDRFRLGQAVLMSPFRQF